jgi:hypothetical protein
MRVDRANPACMNIHGQSASAMDQNGKVWGLVGSNVHGPAPSGQYYFEATPAGGTTIYPLHLPSPDASKLLIPAGPPVVTIGGVVWAEEAYPHRGYLLPFAPKQQGHPRGQKPSPTGDDTPSAAPAPA